MPRLLKTTGMFCGDCVPDSMRAVQPLIETSGVKALPWSSHQAQFSDRWANAGIAANKAAAPILMPMTRLAASAPIIAAHRGVATGHCVPAAGLLTMPDRPSPTGGLA